MIKYLLVFLFLFYSVTASAHECLSGRESGMAGGVLDNKVDLQNLEPKVMNSIREIEMEIWGQKHVLIVNSGFRSVEHNHKVGGSPNSYHLLGLAIDIATHNLSKDEIVKLLMKLQEKGFNGIGIYCRGIIHADLRKTSAVWFEPNGHKVPEYIRRLLFNKYKYE